VYSNAKARNFRDIFSKSTLRCTGRFCLKRKSLRGFWSSDSLLCDRLYWLQIFNLFPITYVSIYTVPGQLYLPFFAIYGTTILPFLIRYYVTCVFDIPFLKTLRQRRRDALHFELFRLHVIPDFANVAVHVVNDSVSSPSPFKYTTSLV
jgi:hypothetical protein